MKEEKQALKVDCKVKKKKKEIRKREKHVLNIQFYSIVIITYAPSHMNLPCVIWTYVRSAQLL